MDEYKDWTRQDLIDHIEEQDREMFDLVAKCVELINKLGWNEFDQYVFNDDDVWSKFDPIQEEDNEDDYGV